MTAFGSHVIFNYWKNDIVLVVKEFDMVAKKAEREVREVSVKDLKDHPGHEGIPDIGEDGFLSLVESVRLNGVMEPVEILSEDDAKCSLS